MNFLSAIKWERNAHAKQTGLSMTWQCPTNTVWTTQYTYIIFITILIPSRIEYSKRGGSDDNGNVGLICVFGQHYPRTSLWNIHLHLRHQSKKQTSTFSESKLRLVTKNKLSDIIIHCVCRVFACGNDCTRLHFEAHVVLDQLYFIFRSVPKA